MIWRRRVALSALRFGMIEQLVSYIFILENELSVATHHLKKLQPVYPLAALACRSVCPTHRPALPLVRCPYFMAGAFQLDCSIFL